MKNYIQALRRYKFRGHVFVLLTLSVILVLLETYQAKSFQMVLNDISNLETLLFYVMINVSVLVVSQVYYVWKTKFIQRFAETCRNDLYYHALHLPVEKMHDMKVGDLTTSIQYVMDVANSIIDLPEWALYIAVSSVFGFILMLLQSKLLTLVLIAEIIPVGIAMILLRKKIMNVMKERRESNSRLNSLIDRIHGYMTVKSFSRERHEYQAFTKESESLYNAASKRGILSCWFGLIARIIYFMTEITILLYGVWTFYQGSFDIAELILFNTLTNKLVTPFLDINKIIVALTELNVHLEANNKILAEPLEQDGEVTLERFDDSIELKNLWFHYSKSDDILQGVNLKIKKGMKVGIYGESGAGKSTIVNLLMKFFNPSKGGIFIDGLNISECNMASLRRKIGIVSQEVYLFSDMTIEENIMYGCSGCNISDIEFAAKQAHAHEFIMELPDGYQSKVGNDGVKLSGGERQRIALARLFLLNPDILILDEATSKLDNGTEYLIKDSIEKLSKDKTVISIAHRFTTIESADLLIGIKNHTIYETGTKESLDHDGTMFHELYHMNEE